MNATAERFQVEATEKVQTLSVAQVAEWLGQQTWSDFAMSLAEYYSNKGLLSEKQEAAGRSMMAKCMARTAEKAAAKSEAPALVPTGMHLHPDGTIIKVYTTQAGHLVGKVLVENWFGHGWTFDYRGKAAVKDLSEATLMGVEDARKFGRLTSQCVNCLAALSDERSVAAGYGPTCAKNHGWDYPSMAEAMEIIAAENLEVPA